MTAKPVAPTEFRMSESAFDSMMRGALAAPVPKKASPKKPSNAKARKKKRAA
jgi:hypothetical protein